MCLTTAATKLAVVISQFGSLFKAIDSRYIFIMSGLSIIGSNECISVTNSEKDSSPLPSTSAAIKRLAKCFTFSIRSSASVSNINIMHRSTSTIVFRVCGSKIMAEVRLWSWCDALRGEMCLRGLLSSSLPRFGDVKELDRAFVFLSNDLEEFFPFLGDLSDFEGDRDCQFFHTLYICVPQVNRIVCIVSEQTFNIVDNPTNQVAVDGRLFLFFLFFFLPTIFSLLLLISLSEEKAVVLADALQLSCSGSIYPLHQLRPGG